MIAYLEATAEILRLLQNDNDINTVVIGSLDKVDLNKQSIFPLAYIIIGEAATVNGLVNFPITISVMDIVDIRKDNPLDGYSGQSNQIDVLNTLLGALTNLYDSLNVGELHEQGWELTGKLTATPFEDQYENLLTGWSGVYNINIPNSIQQCGINKTDLLYALDEILSNILI